MINNGLYLRIILVILIGVFKVSYAFSFNDFDQLYDSAKKHRSIELGQIALQSATNAKDYTQMAKAHYLIAFYLEKQLNYYESVNHYFSALECNQKAGHIEKQATILMVIGKIYAVGGFYNEAIQFYEDGILLSNEIGDESRELSLRYQVARAYQLNGSYEKSASLYQSLIPRFHGKNDEKRMSNCYLSLGYIEAKRGNVDSATYYYSKATEVFSLDGADKQLATLKKMNSLAYLLLQGKSFGQAKSMLLSAIEISRKEKYENGVLAEIYVNLGDLYREIHDKDSAAIMYEKAISLLNLKQFKPDFLVMGDYLYNYYLSLDETKAGNYYQLIYDFANQLSELKSNLQMASKKYQIIAAHHLHQNNLIAKESRDLKIILIGSCLLVALLIFAFGIIHFYRERNKANQRAYWIRQSLKDAQIGRKVIVP